MVESLYNVIDRRMAKCLLKEKHLAGKGTLCDFAMGHYYYGLHRNNNSWVFREWAPNAKRFLLSEFLPIGKRRKNS